MILDISDDKIIIKDKTRSLDSISKSQLSFWNFAFNADESLYYLAFDQQIFLKIIRYFEKEGFPLNLSNSAIIESKKLELLDLNFDEIKRRALDFKNGKFNKSEFDSFKSFLTSNIKRSLKTHQLKGAYHLYITENAANFSVPGSGKTSVVLSVYEKLRQEGKVNNLFVVGPPSSFGPWKHEFSETLGRSAKNFVLAGGNKNARKTIYYQPASQLAELYLTSFHTLLSDKKEVDFFLKQQHVKSFFIVDEAHYIKQINGNWAQAILQQAEKSSRRCVLTGTPMPKSYTDIFNLFDFLWPNRHPIPSRNKGLIKVNEQKGNNHSVKVILKENIAPLFYRVRKSDLLLQPQNFIEPYKIPMGKIEGQIYHAIYKRISDYSKKDFFKNNDFITRIGRGRIMRLRQAVSYPKLLKTAIDNYSETLLEDMGSIKNLIQRYDTLEVPAKVQFLMKLIGNFQRRGLKVVVWTNFIGTIKLIEKHLQEKGYYCKKIFGNTPVDGIKFTEEETREKIRDEFVNPNSGLDILIANPAACAESISLHKTCHHAIYYDLNYNCAQYLQSLDRIHRVGGSETIESNYHFLQYTNSIDSDIKRNIDEKARKMFEIIEEDYSIYSLNMDDGEADAEAYQRIFSKKKPKERK